MTPNFVLKQCRKKAAEYATIIDILQDGEVTTPELINLKFKGTLLKAFDLKALVPSFDDEIKTFDQLNEEEIAYLTQGRELKSTNFIEAIYASCIADYELLRKWSNANIEVNKELPAANESLRLEDVEQVGPATAKKLVSAGISTVEILATKSQESLTLVLGDSPTMQKNIPIMIASAIKLLSK